MGRHVFDPTTDEFSALPLPSSFKNLPNGWSKVAKIEERLRVAQAEEALDDLRGDIGHKSYLYRAKKAASSSTKGVTRSFDEINRVEASMRQHIKRYESARWAMEQLGVSDKYPRFRTISRGDTKAVTAVYDPNRAGERDAELSWIWKIHLKGDSANKDYLEERELFSVHHHVPPT